jgi:2-keto-4-pentenoate hydratase/2-oxohepta-3-ene-1,7-dioic acid hydratase in catechol pathway
MKLATYTRDGASRVGVIVDEKLVDAGFDGTMIDLIGNFEQHRGTLEALDLGAGISIADVHLQAPVLRPGKIFAIGLNYADHIAESNMEMPQRQVWSIEASMAAEAMASTPVCCGGTVPQRFEEALKA